MTEKLNRKTPRILLLNKTQIHEIYKNSSDHLRVIIQLALNTGLRLGEIQSLKFADFDLKNSLVNVCLVNTKTKKHERIIPLNYAAKSCVRILKIGKKESDFLTELSDQAFKMHCYRLSRKLQFKFSFHCFRHTFITAFYNACRDPYLTASIAGHGSILTTMIYVHSVSDQARSAIENLSFDFNFSDQKNFSEIKFKKKIS